jgi:histone H3/H4
VVSWGGLDALAVVDADTDETGGTMAAKKQSKKGTSSDLIISKSRTKAATKKCNVSSDFYGALDKVVRGMIAAAESRAIGNKRKTLKPVDL